MDLASGSDPRGLVGPDAGRPEIVARRAFSIWPLFFWRAGMIACSPGWWAFRDRAKRNTPA